jgi:hypothetical protein
MNILLPNHEGGMKSKRILKWNKIDDPYSSNKKAVSEDSWSQPLLLLSFI